MIKNASSTSDKDQKTDFPYLLKIKTRWSDYDMLRHINNVTFYRYIEHVVLDYLRLAGIDWINDEVIPYAVESCCHFRKPVPVTEEIEAGLRVTKLGRSSVIFEIGLFIADDDQSCGFGRFVHVYVGRQNEKAMPIPEPIRNCLEKIMTKPG